MFEAQTREILTTLGIAETNRGVSNGRKWLAGTAAESPISSHTPADNQQLAAFTPASADQFEQLVEKANEAFHHWRTVTPPERGEVIRKIGLKLRAYKEALGTLVSLEAGKIYQEGLGEVQEMIDMADFCVGQSRMMYGRTMASERPNHRMFEQWHPMGPVGIITAFNFPVAVYSWNTFNAIIAGDPVIWKPSEKSTLCAIAVQNLIQEVLEAEGVPEGVFNLAAGDADIGNRIASDTRLPIVSATGSVAMGRKVGPKVQERFGRPILELGGNNGIIISQHGDLEMALRAVLFGAVGTAGQRCTSTRRLIIHESVYEDFKHKLINAYKQLQIGHPLDDNTMVGPLIDQAALDNFRQALQTVEHQGGKIVQGGETVTVPGCEAGFYVNPAIAEAAADTPMLQEETFGPLLYLTPYQTFEEAVQIHNNVPQGLSSGLFSLNVQEVEHYLSAAGSDVGISNVNIATSGAEIGGAFGGEKVTGGSREAGSDAWKNYMRRQTNTINYGSEMPLAQGIQFGV
jgi:aldehyde dehydrogenase (NAD+)